MLAEVQDDKDYNWCTLFGVVLASECADIRDKAFSVLGLLPERLRFYPDNSLEGHEVVLQIARTHVADRVAVLDKRCAEGNFILKKATADNILEVLFTIFLTCSWYYGIYQG